MVKQYSTDNLTLIVSPQYFTVYILVALINLKSVSLTDSFSHNSSTYSEPNTVLGSRVEQ